MARRKTHKFAVQTKGLTTEQAAQLAYIISCAAFAIAEESEFACNVPLTSLRAEFPDASWHRATTEDRRRLVG